MLLLGGSTLSLSVARAYDEVGDSMTYVDGYVIPIDRDAVPSYKKRAEDACKRWMEHGALDVKECVAEDLDPEIGPGTQPGFPAMAELGPDETIVFAWIEFESREHRDEVNAAVMEEFEEESIDEEAMPFDTKRMAYAGFDVIVDGPS